MGPVPTVVGITILLVVVAAVPFGLLARRRAFTRTAIGQSALIVRQGLPLAAGLAAAADGEYGKTRRVLRRISYWVGQGLSLSGALARRCPGCPGLVVSTVAAGERMGQLPGALEALEGHLAHEDKWRARFRINWPYAVIVPSFTLMILSGALYFVIPKFRHIFADFDIELPAVTLFIIGIGDHLQFGTGIAPLIILVAAILGIYVTFRPRRPAKPRLLSLVGDGIKWSLPGWRTMQEATGMVWIIRILRLGLAAGESLDRAARQAAEVDVNMGLRKRVGRWADSMEKGVSPHEAARAVGLDDLFVQTLHTGSRDGSMEVAMRYAEQYYAAKSVHWLMIVGQAAWPFVVLAMGLMVGTFALAMFTPLVALIESSIRAIP
ncbi:MAG TPA: type II secretion system F family protein [Phycisphaerae bacterium]|nr:type II secretion system F family protein [Phycisphaerae bacterium]